MTQQLKLEINNLTRLVEAGAGLSIGEEATMNEMLQQKEELTKERDAQVCGVGLIGWSSGFHASRPCKPFSYRSNWPVRDLACAEAERGVD